MLSPPCQFVNDHDWAPQSLLLSPVSTYKEGQSALTQIKHHLLQHHARYWH